MSRKRVTLGATLGVAVAALLVVGVYTVSTASPGENDGAEAKSEKDGRASSEPGLAPASAPVIEPPAEPAAQAPEPGDFVAPGPVPVPEPAPAPRALPRHEAADVARPANPEPPAPAAPAAPADPGEVAPKPAASPTPTPGTSPTPTPGTSPTPSPRPERGEPTPQRSPEPSAEPTPTPTPEPSPSPSPSPTPTPKPTPTPTPKPHGPCYEKGSNQLLVERYLQAHPEYGPVTVDGRQSPQDCVAIQKFQQRYGVEPAVGRAGATTGEVVTRLNSAATGSCITPRGTLICVDLSSQTMWVVRDGSIVMGPTPVRTGRAEKTTPVGDFHISEKKLLTPSTDFPVLLPNWQRFEGDQGFHTTTSYLYEGPGSHGCVNLLPEDSNALYGMTKAGNKRTSTAVRIFGRKPGA